MGIAFLLASLTALGSAPVQASSCFERVLQETLVSNDSKSKVTRLLQFGYDPVVAKRIVEHRPDLFTLITSSEVQITPDKLIARPDLISTFPREEMFATQSQDRSLITVYRGIEGSGKTYNPEYYHGAPYMPEIGSASDLRTFASDKLTVANSYSRGSRGDGIVLRMQIPRFLLYTHPGGPYGFIFFRDMVPNDLMFVTDVAFMKPGTEAPQFIPLKDALKNLPLAQRKKFDY